MKRLTDYEVYKELSAVQQKLDALSEQALSVRSRAALRAVAEMVRKLASALFKASF